LMLRLSKELINACERKNINPHDKEYLLLSLDVNGPLTPVNDASLTPYNKIPELMNQLKEKGAYLVLNSGWDVKTLRAFDEKYLNNTCAGYVGENGVTYEIKNHCIRAPTINKEKLINLFQEVLKYCSQHDTSLACQANLVNPSFYFGAEQIIQHHPCTKPTPSEEELAATLRKSGVQCEVTTRSLKLPNNATAMIGLLKTLTNEYALTHVKVKMNNKDILIKLSEYTSDIKLKLLEELGAHLKNKGLCHDFSINEDKCIDFFIHYSELDKGQGLQEFINEFSKLKGINKERVLILGVGDGSGDVKMKNTPNTIFYGLKGSKAEKEADLTVSSGEEFLRKASEVIT